MDLLPFKGPFPLTGALTGRPGRAGVLYGAGSLPREERPFFRGKLTGSYEKGRLLTGRPLQGAYGSTFNYRKAYGKAGPLREAPYKEGRFLREGRDGPYGKGRSLTGRAGVPYGSFTEKDDEEAYGKAGPLREAPYREERSLREGPYRKGRELHREGRRDVPPPRGLFTGALTGTTFLRYGALTGRPPYGKPYREERSLREGAGPYGKGRGPLRGCVPSQKRTTFNYRKAYGKLRGGTLPELGGNFRLCAVDQKRSFFPRVGPFLDLLPCKGFFPLTGALTGRPPYGKAPYGEASYRKASSGRFLTGDTFNYRKAYGKLRGGILPELGGNFRLCAVDQKRSFFPRVGPFLDLLPFKELFPLTGALTGRPPYGPLRGGFLREGPLRGCFLRETPLIIGKLTGSYGEGLYQNWAGISACVP